MTDFHYFEAPTDTFAGTLNPVFELLDFPIVMGGADDIVLTGPTPESPLVDGREVTDPRLVKALSKPVELDRAEVLDRSAKLGGILRAMGVVGTESERVVIAEDVPPISRALSILGAVRIGASVDVRSGAASTLDTSSAKSSSAQAGAEGITTVIVHTIDAPPIESGRASVKVIRSQFEGVGITVAGETANIDQAMRDSRVEPAAVAALRPDRPLIVIDEKLLDAQSSLEWLSQEILAEV
ncbi:MULTISPECIES: hypothetical protein [Brevibacterium]|uniref:Uncharacterized protein n=2 Tax=Brevibacterium antiquum TaxID=234835 RepID=A0A2H1JF70_9MICO|nr:MULTISPECIES: hypothetical protein [Brevibacterium]SMX72142.1 hypothetical protein BANT10_00758 [Brevibacterium antiquum]SMX85802.1 hypothetical protein BANT918_01566 [Brevibacterium antiquum CNRZ 918]HCG57244.1 hypothetical protein [Brevibacterium sp.]